VVASRDETRNAREEGRNVFKLDTRNAKVTRPPESTVDRWPIIGFSVCFVLLMERMFICELGFQALLAIPIARGPNEL
jgi:hypothetical protein